MKTVLVTGGAGFIGSAVIRRLIGSTDINVVNVDKLTYASNLASLQAVAGSPRYHFEQADVCDGHALARIFGHYEPDAVLHLAAESHVDRSIAGAAPFIQTNIVGTYLLLETALGYWRKLDENRRAAFRFHHVSTDEVFGSLEFADPGGFDEDTSYRPNSPYSASKAAADHLVRAWSNTYGLPVVVSNTSNNYGPYQHPEKFMPTVIISALRGKKIPIYGAGRNVRDWLFVEDHAHALIEILLGGEVGETYCVGGNAESANIDVARSICEILDGVRPRKDGRRYAEQIAFVTDRPGHDLRYAIASKKMRERLGFTPATSFDEGLRRTVRWYIENENWWAPTLGARADTVA